MRDSWTQLLESGKRYRWSHSKHSYIFEDGSPVPQDQLPANERTPPVGTGSSSPTKAVPLNTSGSSNPQPVVNDNSCLSSAQPTRATVGSNAVASAVNSRNPRIQAFKSSAPEVDRGISLINLRRAELGYPNLRNVQTDLPNGQGQAIVNSARSRLTAYYGDSRIVASWPPPTATGKVSGVTNDTRTTCIVPNPTQGQDSVSNNNSTAEQPASQTKGPSSGESGSSKTVVATDSKLGVQQTWHIPLRIRTGRESGYKVIGNEPTIVDALTGDYHPRGFTSGAQSSSLVFGTVFETILVVPPSEEDLSAITATPSYRDAARPQRYIIIAAPTKDYPYTFWALKISTYVGQGVAADGVIKGEHAIIHTTPEPPRPAENEEPQGSEEGMLPREIRIDCILGFSLTPMARINFGAIHSFETGVSIRVLGQTAKRSHEDLHFQFQKVWFGRRKFISQRHTINSSASDTSTTSGQQTIVPWAASSAGTVVNFPSYGAPDRGTSRPMGALFKPNLEAGSSNPGRLPASETLDFQSAPANAKFSNVSSTQSSSLASTAVYGEVQSLSAQRSPRASGEPDSLAHRPNQYQEYTAEDLDKRMGRLKAYAERHDLPLPSLRDRDHRLHLILSEAPRNQFFENIELGWRRILAQRNANASSSEGLRKTSAQQNANASSSEGWRRILAQRSANASSSKDFTD